MNRISKNNYNKKDKIKHIKNEHDQINQDGKTKHKKKIKLTKKQKIVLLSILAVIGIFIIVFLIKLGTYIYKADGNIADAAINMMADVVGDENPITALVMGVSEGIDTPLTDTIILVRI